MNNAEYWKLRFEQLEQAQNQKGVKAYADIERQYKEAQKQLEGQIARWYQRFATKVDMSKMTYEELANYIENNPDAE